MSSVFLGWCCKHLAGRVCLFFHLTHISSFLLGMLRGGRGAPCSAGSQSSQGKSGLALGRKSARMNICPVAPISCLAFSKTQLEKAQEHRCVCVCVCVYVPGTLLAGLGRSLCSSPPLVRAFLPQNSQNQHFAGELFSLGNTSSLFCLMSHLAHVGKRRCCLGTRSDAMDELGRREVRWLQPLPGIPEPPGLGRHLHTA